MNKLIEGRKHSKPYLLGRKAALEGKPLSANPYKTGRHIFVWQQGYEEAQPIVAPNVESGSQEHLDTLCRFFGI